MSRAWVILPRTRLLKKRMMMLMLQHQPCSRLETCSLTKRRRLTWLLCPYICLPSANHAACCLCYTSLFIKTLSIYAGVIDACACIASSYFQKERQQKQRAFQVSQRCKDRRSTEAEETQKGTTCPLHDYTKQVSDDETNLISLSKTGAHTSQASDWNCNDIEHPLMQEPTPSRIAANLDLPRLLGTCEQSQQQTQDHTTPLQSNGQER